MIGTTFRKTQEVLGEKKKKVSGVVLIFKDLLGQRHMQQGLSPSRFFTSENQCSSAVITVILAVRFTATGVT